MHVKPLFGVLLAALFVNSVIASASKLTQCWDCKNVLDDCTKVNLQPPSYNCTRTALTMPTEMRGTER
jgi:hypothetical protein